MASSSETELPASLLPRAGISRVRFHGRQRQVLAFSSWDGSVSVVDTHQQRLLHRHSRGQDIACLDVDMEATSLRVYSGWTDGWLTASGEGAAEGDHQRLIAFDGACSAVAAIHSLGAVAASSWSGDVVLVDERQQGAVQRAPAGPKVFRMAASSDHKVVVARVEGRLDVYDVRRLHEAVEQRQSPLQHQTRSLAVFPDNSGFALGSIQGRVAVEWFRGTAKKPFAFKCHRVKTPDVDKVYPVNAIAFNPRDQTFVTGGSDRLVNLWDPASRKLLTQYHQYDEGIASLSYNCDGSLLATAVSYTFDTGEKEDERNPIINIFIRQN